MSGRSAVTPIKQEWRTASVLAGSQEERRLQAAGWEPFGVLLVVPSDAMGLTLIWYRTRINV
jgi:hypothetical protein